MKLRKGDKVKVFRGKDAGKSGQVLQVLPARDAAVVEGINVRYRHLRPRKTNEKGQRVEFPAPLNVSNVMLICPKCSKPTRVAQSDPAKGQKQRACKKCQTSFK